MVLRKRNVFDVLDSVSDQPTKAANVLVRVDFNVPMSFDGTKGTITDDSRIRAALPTIKAITDAKCNAILVSHMGRPKLVQKGEDNEETKTQKHQLSLRPASERLSKLLGKPVGFGEDCIGDKAKAAVEDYQKKVAAYYCWRISVSTRLKKRTRRILQSLWYPWLMLMSMMRLEPVIVLMLVSLVSLH